MLPRFQLLIADRRPIAASGLAAVFEDAAGLVVQTTCHEVRELASCLGSAGKIEAVIVDVEMFDGDASRAVGAVRPLAAGVAVLLLTTRVDESLLEALAHDRVSCVSAYSDGQAIVSALRALLGGRPLLPLEVHRALLARLKPSPPQSPVLTSREEQVLELAATGLTISQIGGRLNISHSTAKTHLLRVYEKLDAPNRSAAVATAVARGMLSVSSSAA
jgi:DNA-binding NarL/FixJ family response regulator